MSTPLSLQPLPETKCPLCGGPNGCIPAATGSFGQSCWCKEVTFSKEVLSKVPASMVNHACIYQKCAQAVNTQLEP